MDLQTLLNEFVRFLDELPYSFAVDIEVADQMFNLAESTCSGCVLFLCIFESWNCDVSVEIIELLEQLLKLYEELTKRYRERLQWLAEAGATTTAFKANRNHLLLAVQDREEGHGLKFLSHKSKD